MNMNSSVSKTSLPDTLRLQTDIFYKDVLDGLQSSPKYLESKYFYDAIGDQLFRELMNCNEYYLTNCELEIFSKKTAELSASIMGNGDSFDLIELGAGDALKSTYLLNYLLEQEADFNYLPIDISSNVISNLTNNLPDALPKLQIMGLNGEYFDMLNEATSLSSRRKVVLFLGSNIGNMPISSVFKFCEELRKHLSTGDKVLIGMDLKKNPKTILAAYNDKGGITKRFNLNLLERINRELHADFDLNKFDHYAMYDPENGSCKSYLISLADQVVHINGREYIHFLKDEQIYMEISQKFTLSQIEQIARDTGFKPLHHFFDSRGWFVDTIWTAD